MLYDSGKMQKPVSEKTLVEGVWFAMEQAGRLLNTAVRVFEDGDSGSAVALAMFAHEELGRSRILLDLAESVHLGRVVNATDVRDRCNDHLEKQRRGAFSVTHRVLPGDPLAAAVSARFKSAPGSIQFRAARAQIDSATLAVGQAQPRRRHQDRMSAVYLDLSADGQTWVKPAEFDRTGARDRLLDAVGDYSTGRQWFDEPFLSTNDPGLLAANPRVLLLRNWRPSGLVLPASIWPSMSA